jgi:acetoin utilization protein AcuB
MLVSDVMSKNVVTIPSHTSLSDGRRIMDAQKFRRLPVVDGDKLVGIVTKDTLDRTGPSQLTTFSVHELSYLLNRITVEKVMRKEVVSVTPDTTVEKAVALAQAKKVGALVVLQDRKIVGIVTTNDFFYKVLNHILGIGMPGSRIVVCNCYRGRDVEKVIAAINKAGIEITTLFTIDIPEANKHDLVIHLEAEDPSSAIKAIEQLGYEVCERER